MKKYFLLTLLIVLFSSSVYSQDEGYKFTNTKELPTTSVKNQFRSGTCWSFSALSFFESELMRMGKKESDLSDMFIVYYTYLEKAIKYVRLHGNLTFSAGGAFHDVSSVLENYGMTPEEVYDGLNMGYEKHVHGEMDAVLSSFVKGVVKNKNKKLTKNWLEAYKGILNAYLGKIPKEFVYKGKQYTPKSYAEELGFNYDDYISLTSYTHHPFYGQFAIEVPDNWMWKSFYNLPINELMEVFNYSIDNGYSILWGADVSEKGFARKEGLMVVPETDFEDLSDTEQSRWDNLSQSEKNKEIYGFDKPRAEKKITQEMRQLAYDNYETTDDHGMHITGKAKDKNGNKYFIVKNSWSKESSPYDGYYYASEAFVAYKTMNILIHKDGIPKNIRKKLGMM